jgi:hypothetical protein
MFQILYHGVIVKLISFVFIRAFKAERRELVFPLRICEKCEEHNSVALIREQTIPTAACLQSYCELLRVEGVAWSEQWILAAVFSTF